MDTAAEAMHAHGASGPEEALDQLLRQIISGFFVLTDGAGALSKWSEPAELLFGLDAEGALGKPLFGSVVAGALPPAGAAWKRFLEEGEPRKVTPRPKCRAVGKRCAPGGADGGVGCTPAAAWSRCSNSVARPPRVAGAKRVRMDARAARHAVLCKRPGKGSAS